MSEKRWRAALKLTSVDEIEIVNETEHFVDVRSERSGAWAASIRREAKSTEYYEIHKSEREAWQAVAAHIQAQIGNAEAQLATLTNRLTKAKLQLGKLDVADSP